MSEYFRNFNHLIKIYIQCTIQNSQTSEQFCCLLYYLLLLIVCQLVYLQEWFNFCHSDKIRGYHYPFAPTVYQTMGFYSTYFSEYGNRLIIVVFLQWSGSFFDPCSVIINWFFQFIYCCRCYSHQLFSTFITDETNIVHCVLELIPRVHLLILT